MYRTQTRAQRSRHRAVLPITGPSAMFGVQPQDGSQPQSARHVLPLPRRTLAPHSPVLAQHPAAVYVREAAICAPPNQWIATLFDATNRDRTVQALLDSQGGSLGDTNLDQARRRLANAEARLRRHQAAIEAGVDPAAIVDAINQAQTERAAARAELDERPTTQELTRRDVEAMIDSIGDVGTALTQVQPQNLTVLYETLRLQMVYDPASRAVDVTVQPRGRVNSARVRGGTRTRVRGIPAQSRCACDRS